jgi:hypothetical protein
MWHGESVVYSSFILLLGPDNLKKNDQSGDMKVSYLPSGSDLDFFGTNGIIPALVGHMLATAFIGDRMVR